MLGLGINFHKNKGKQEQKGIINPKSNDNDFNKPYFQHQENQDRNNNKEEIIKESSDDNSSRIKKKKEKLKTEGSIKKNLEKKNIYIKNYEKDNENLKLMIEEYESRRNKLLERADQPRKNKQKMKDIENEIKTLEENIIKYKVEGAEKEQNMEETKTKNNELIEYQKKEIDGHQNIIKDIQNQIKNENNININSVN